MQEEFQLDVTWLPFEIHPETPFEGVLLAERFQQVDREAMFTGLNQSGRPYNIRFNRIERLYNSRAALEVSELARDKGVYDDVHTRLFTAYFHEGQNIGDSEVLCTIAEKTGLKREDVTAVLEEERYKDRLISAMEEGRGQNVSAVPTFVFDDNRTLTGAQPIEMFKYILAGGSKGSPLTNF